MANKLQIKRTTISGRTPNTTNSGNTHFIDTGELALNLTDGKLFSSNGTASFEIGANLATQKVTGDSYVNKLNVTASSGDEGGEIFLAAPANNTTISGGITIDAYQNKLRFFEQGGSARGAYIDLTACASGAGTNLLSGGGGGSGTVTQVNTGNGLTGGPITASGTISVNANTGIVSNSSGLFVNSTYISTLSTNFTNGQSISVANLVITGSVTANSSTGTSGQVLSSNGSAVYWADSSAGGGTAAVGITFDTFTGNGTNTVFTLSGTPSSENTVFPVIDGVAQLKSSFTISGNNITFSEAPANGAEIDVTVFAPASSGTFTSRTYTGTGACTQFTVSSGVTNSSSLVMENGIVQTPVTDYTVTGTTLTFTTAPANGVNIQIRELAAATATASLDSAGSYTVNNLTTTSTLVVGNSSVNSVINSTSITTGLLFGNGTYLTSVPAVTLGGNTATDLRNYSDSKSSDAYSNAIAFAGNADNLNFGVVSPARLPQANTTSNGAVILLDSVTNTSIAIYAATANSVKTAYDVAVFANSRAFSAQTEASAAYSNGVTYTDNKAGNAYSNAISYAGSIAGTAYSNAVTYTDNKAGNAYSNATAYASNADNLSSGTVSPARLPQANTTSNGAVIILDSVTNTSISIYAASANSVKTAYDAAINANTRAASAQTEASAAYSNATTYSSNADNLSSGTVAPARLPQANTTANGAVIILDSVTNTSISIYAASANSVKTAYDAAINANTAAGSAYTNAVSHANSIAATAYTNAASYADTKASDAYTNATAYSSNATNISSGTLSNDRLPGTIGLSTMLYVGNSTVNTAITPTSVDIDGTLNVTGVGTFSNTVQMSNNVIANVADPVNPKDAVNKQYVDAIAEGLHIHGSCEAATPDTLATLSGGTVTYNNGTSGVGATLTLSSALSTLDGYTLQNGDRVLVKNEANTFHNGIYTRTSSTVLTRATDTDTAIEMAGGDFTFVTNGTLYNNTGWVQTEPVNTVGSDPVLYVQFSGSGTYTAGNYLYLNGSQFNANGTSTATASVLIARDSEANFAANTANLNTINVGANLSLTTSFISVGNSTVNSVINSTSISSTNLSGNGASVTSVDAAKVGGNTASDLRSYSDTVSGTAYTNATTYSSNADNLSSGTVSPARLPQANSTSNGSVLILDSVTNTSISIYAASANSVKTAYDAASSAYSNATLYSSNADNISSGTLSNSRLPAVINVATSVNSATISVGSAFIANSSQLTISGITLSANGSVGSQGQLLYSNGTTGSPYWDAAPSVSVPATYVQNTDSRTLSGNLVISGTYFNPSANTILLGNSISRWVISANTGDFSGSITGTTADLSTSVNSALITVGSSFIANTTGAYHTGIVNAASHTTSGVTANATGVYPSSNTTGDALGLSTARWELVANTGDFSGNTNFASFATFATTTDVLQTKTSSTGTVTHDLSVGPVFFHTSISASYTANFTNVPTTNDRIIVTTLIHIQGATAYIPSAVQIDGVAQTINWVGGTAPTGGANKEDVFTFALIRSSSAWTVLGNYSSFG